MFSWNYVMVPAFDSSERDCGGWRKATHDCQRALLYLALVLALEVVATAQNLDEPPSWAFTVAGPD
jgi:hypothetical protein